MTYEQSPEHPCLYFAWFENELIILVAWADDVMILGPPDMVEQVQRDLEKELTCKCKGELMEYVGSKLALSREILDLGVAKFT